MMRTLTSREKALTISATAAIGAIGLLQLVILPALTSRQESLAHLTKFETMSAILDALPTQQPDNTQTALPPLRERVTDTARRAGLEIRRLDPQGAQALSVFMDDVPFAAVIGWLDQLTGAAQARVLSAEIGRSPEPGIVSARFLLETN